MSHLPKRVIIYPKDVMNITGKGDRAARKLLCKIRKKNSKEQGALVTVEEFCAHTGLKADQVNPFLL